MALVATAAAGGNDDFVDVAQLDGSWGDFDEDLAILDELLDLDEDEVIHGLDEKSPKEDPPKKVDKAGPRFGSDASPDVIPSMEEVEKLLAEEMERMSLEEKREIMEDIQGVQWTMVEDMKSVSLQLDVMRARLKFFETRSDYPGMDACLEAYRIALRQDPEYVRSQSYLLMFLRAARYDPFRAACRLVCHMTEKRTLFGTDMLTKDLEMKDMNDDDRAAMESDCVTVLPFRSKNGSAVIQVKTANWRWDVSGRSLKRAFWYMTMDALKDPLTQFQGFVCVILHTGTDPQAYLHIVKLFEGTERYLPNRCRGAVYFAEDPTCKDTIPLVRFHMSQATRTRFRAVIGPIDESYKILSKNYGIYLTSFKLPDYAEAALIEQSSYIFRRRLMSQHRQRLELKQAGESDSDVKASEKPPKSAKSDAEQPKIITELNDNDVLWGRGKSRDYVGNMRAQKIVEELKPRYMESDRYGKTTIVLEALQKIKKNGVDSSGVSMMAQTVKVLVPVRLAVGSSSLTI